MVSSPQSPLRTYRRSLTLLAVHLTRAITLNAAFATLCEYMSMNYALCGDFLSQEGTP